MNSSAARVETGAPAVFAGYELGGDVVESLFRDGLCLPSGTAMSEADQARVVGVIRGVRRS